MAKVHTVLGCMDAKDMGRTLTHEHLSCLYQSPSQEEQLPWTLDSLYQIQRYPYENVDNCRLNDANAESAILESVVKFKEAGGGCLVDNTTQGLRGGRTRFLKELSQKTGVHVVSGTGYYVDSFLQKLGINTESVEVMTNHMVQELEEGCVDEPDIKCGLIGEIGISDPLTSVEKQSLEAAAAAQAVTGAPVSIHPGRCVQSPFDIMRIFLEAGGNPRKMILSHTERTLQSYDKLSEFAKFGTYIQYDLFGIETSYYSLLPTIDFPSDAQRIDAIKYLVEEENIPDRVLVAHDIHTKHRLEAYGGHGFKHLLVNIAPQMLVKGISQDQIDKIFIENPAQVLAY